MAAVSTSAPSQREGVALRPSVHARTGRAHRGPIRSSLAAWRWTVVWLSIPVGERAHEFDGLQRAGPASSGYGARSSEKTTILLDDHASFGWGAQHPRARAGFEIVGEADDTRGAFDLSVQLSPDIILMDLSLPAPGGIETTQRIKRELPRLDHRPGRQRDEDALFDAIKAGAAAFILKT